MVDQAEYPVVVDQVEGSPWADAVPRGVCSCGHGDAQRIRCTITKFLVWIVDPWVLRAAERQDPVGRAGPEYPDSVDRYST